MYVVPRGLEPRTLWLLAVRSDQLSYETVKNDQTLHQSLWVSRVTIQDYEMLPGEGLNKMNVAPAIGHGTSRTRSKNRAARPNGH